MEVLEEWQEREGIYACFLATLPDPREGGGVIPTGAPFSGMCRISERDPCLVLARCGGLSWLTSTFHYCRRVLFGEKWKSRDESMPLARG